NLANRTLLDSNSIGKEVAYKLNNSANDLITGLTFADYDSKIFERMGVDPRAAIIPFSLPQKSVTEHVVMLNQIISMMERVVNMSAQEAGSYASHEQSAEERRVIHTATSQRYEYVASWIDRAIEAWKSQLYSYAMQYGKAETLAFISPELVANAEKAGFTI